MYIVQRVGAQGAEDDYHLEALTDTGTLSVIVNWIQRELTRKKSVNLPPML